MTSAQSTVRKQFGMSIGAFEGIAEPLARIGGFNYIMEAARRYTLGAIDSGVKPPVVTAIANVETDDADKPVEAVTITSIDISRQ